MFYASDLHLKLLECVCVCLCLLFLVSLFLSSSFRVSTLEHTIHCSISHFFFLIVLRMYSYVRWDAMVRFVILAAHIMCITKSSQEKFSSFCVCVCFWFFVYFLVFCLCLFLSPSSLLMCFFFFFTIIAPMQPWPSVAEIKCFAYV